MTPSTLVTTSPPIPANHPYTLEKRRTGQSPRLLYSPAMGTCAANDDSVCPVLLFAKGHDFIPMLLIPASSSAGWLQDFGI